MAALNMTSGKVQSIMWISFFLIQVAQAATLSTCVLIGVVGGAVFVLVAAVVAIICVILVCRRCLRKRRTYRTQAQSLELEPPEDRYQTRSDMQYRDVTQDIPMHSNVTKCTSQTPNAISKAYNTQPPGTLQSPQTEHVQSFTAGSTHKRPGGYEWMVPARATLPRITEGASKPNERDRLKMHRSEENISSSEYGYRMEMRAVVKRAHTLHIPSQRWSHDSEDYEDMKPPNRPFAQYLN